LSFSRPGDPLGNIGAAYTQAPNDGKAGFGMAQWSWADSRFG